MKKLHVTEGSLFFNMAVIGGFLGGYAVIRCDILASSQTVNVIDMLFGFYSGNIFSALVHLGGLALFAAAIFIVSWLKHRTRLKNTRIFALAMEAAAVIAVGFIPDTDHMQLVLYPLFFTMVMHWDAMRGANGYTSASVFSSNNFYQAISGLADYTFTRDDKRLRHAAFFGCSLLSFYIGATAAYWSFRLAHNRAIWFCLIILAAAVFQEIRLRAEKHECS